MTLYSDHLAAAETYERRSAESLSGPEDVLLYVSRPSSSEPVRYVWRSGVKLGLAASISHLNRLVMAAGHGGKPEAAS